MPTTTFRTDRARRPLVIMLAALAGAGCWGQDDDLLPAPAPEPAAGSTALPRGLSGPERAAVAEARAQEGELATVTLAIVSADGTVDEVTVPAGQAEAEADRLAAGGHTVAVSFGVQAQDVSSTADPQLLFAGKEVFGMADWIRQYPEADGRGVRIAVVDDGVALGRPGLERTSGGQPKVAAVINTASGWSLPLYPPGQACHRPPRTAAASAAWTVPEGAGLADPGPAGLRVPFDLTPCGINPFLRTRPLYCESWEAHFPGAEDRQLDGVLTVAALYLEVPGSDEQPPARAVLVDVDGDGRIAVAEVFRPISDGGGHLRLADGGALAFDVHPSASLVPAEPGVLGNDVEVCPTPAAQTLTVALPQIGNHGEGVAAIAAGHDIAGQGVEGMAPGAQVVDVQFQSISDTHPYTFAEIARALQTAGRHADVVNLSYSLYFSSPVAQLAMRRVLEAALGPTQALYFFSAGNNGPGRGSMNRALLYPSFGVPVGAYLDPLLAQTTFGSALPLPGVVAYSSRGPGFDGASGPLLLSPLAGIVPSTADEGLGPFSGTSSATPALAGFAARLISQIRSEGLAVSRDRVRRALLQAARPLPDVPFIDQGWGIPRLTDALAHYRRLSAAERTPPGLAVGSIHGRDGVGQTGIYVRDRIGREGRYTFILQPTFDASWSEQARADYSARLEIVAGVPWLSAPPAALLGRSGIALDVVVDWASLPASSAGEHLSDVRVYEVGSGADGERTRQLRAIIPVTVLIPSPAPLNGERGFADELVVPANDLVRRFLPRPDWATHLVAAIESTDPEQRLCGDFEVYTPHGGAPELAEARSGSYRQEASFATPVAGLYELVVIANEFHTVCGKTPQRVRLTARWIQLSTTFRNVQINPPPATPPYQVALLLNTRAPLLIGDLVLDQLGESFRVDLRPGDRPWQWLSDSTVDLTSFLGFGFRFDGDWVRSRANLPNLLAFSQFGLLAATPGALPHNLPLSVSGELRLSSVAAVPAALRTGARLGLVLFDAGADPGVAPGRIPLIGHGVPAGLAGVSATTRNVQLTSFDPRPIAVTFPVPLEAVRGKTARCRFEPLDYQVGVPCGMMQIW